MIAPEAAEILLVEDDSRDVELTLRALKKAKLSNRIFVARDGAEALKYLFCEGAFAERPMCDMPSFVLLDLKLPKVDGVSVLKRIRGDKRTRSIPVIVLTSSKQQNDVVDSYRLGVNSYIVKPVSFERFYESVREIGMYWLLLNHPPAPGP